MYILDINTLICLNLRDLLDFQMEMFHRHDKVLTSELWPVSQICPRSVLYMAQAKRPEVTVLLSTEVKRDTKHCLHSIIHILGQLSAFDQKH